MGSRIECLTRSTRQGYMNMYPRARPGTGADFPPAAGRDHPPAHTAQSVSRGIGLRNLESMPIVEDLDTQFTNAILPNCRFKQQMHLGRAGVLHHVVQGLLEG